jgi:hypothetical protein
MHNYASLFLSQLAKGQTSAWLNDQKDVQARIWEWLEFTPYSSNAGARYAHDPNLPLIKGFKEGSVMGALLCPVALDWSNEEFESSYTFT